MKVVCDESLSEILIAQLSQTGYNSFIENEDGFESYIESDKFNKSELKKIFSQTGIKDKIEFYINEIEEENWNKEWEKQYDPVIINEKCLIRASFHKFQKKYPYEIIINPKMSFGTGHHDTTWLMLNNQLHTDHKNLLVLDAGCGTGILSIMAEKRGAANIIAFDIDDWAINNAKENVELNRCRKIRIIKGDISAIEPTEKFHLILANINRNIILKDISMYSGFLSEKGDFICSGFFESDIPVISQKAEKHNLRLHSRNARNQWASLVFKKKSG